MKKLWSVAILWIISVLLVWCWQQKMVTNTQLPVVEEAKELTWPKTRDDFTDAEKMNIHMCLMWWWENCDEIFEESKRETYSDAIKEQCEIMAWMEKCNEYFGIDESIVTNPFNLEPSVDAPEVGLSEVIELQDGDSYTITIEEVTKTIDGKKLRMLAYNGTIPWPVLKAPQWSKINLTVINNVDDIETTVHHHGLRHDDRYDGVPKDMGGYDDPITKWESLEYVLEFPDSGLFRYHPHVREDLQQELGLYWNYLIEWTWPDDLVQTNSEQILMFDDLFLDEDGSMVPFDKEKWTWVVMGRFGNTPILNGSTDYEISLKKGEVTRLYITNVANVTPFNITIPGLEMKLVWGDIGKYEREEKIENLVIAPAERYIVDVYASDSWERRIMNQMSDWNYPLWTIIVDEEEITDSYKEAFDTLASYEWVIADIDQYREYFDKPIDKTLRLDVEMDWMEWEMPSHWDHPHGEWDHDTVALPWWLDLDPWTIEWKDEMPVMNEASTTDNTRWFLVDEESSERNMDIMWTFEQWDIVKIRIFNDPDSVHPMQHPVHFHGQRFLVLNKNWEENQNLVWKDTVLVPTGEYVDILLDASNPWKWMVHCHIAEHLTAWMMMHFMVKEKEIEN